MNDNGIIYLNSGKKMLPRLLVSVYSLRKVYNGNISIVQIGDDGLDIINEISDKFNCQIIYSKQELNIKHHYWFEKSRINIYTPYKNTIFIDSDTLINKNFNELFIAVDQHKFIVPQFAHWTTKNRKIQKRLSYWKNIEPDLFKKAIDSKMPSVNVGVYGFTDNSELMKNWFRTTIQIKNAPLPEESSCHLLLNRYDSCIVDSIYNYSCKHDLKPIEDAKIIHYHGRKHCRKNNKNNNYLYNGNLWVSMWRDIFLSNISDVKTWHKECNDSYIKNL